MRKTIITVAIILLSLFRNSYSQNPTFELRATNFTPLNQITNAIEFDITLKWTNPGVAPNFEYAGGQYFFNFNAAIANGGTFQYIFALDTSDLPPNMRPRSPSAYTLSTPAQLRLAVNSFPGPGNGYQMPPNIPVKIIRMRLSTSAAGFYQIENFGIQWRDSLPNPFTKVLAYVGTTNTDLTNPPRRFQFPMDFPPSSATTLSVKFGIEGLCNNNQHLRRDTALIQIRSSVAPYPELDTERVILDSLSLTTTFITNVSPGNYYIVIKHRNSLETWSKPGGEPLGSGDYFYDFTSSASQAYGNNLVLKNGLYCIYSGNLNDDNVIDADDMLIMDNAVYNYASGNNIANLNGDQIVDIDDMAICDNNARAIRVVERPNALDKVQRQMMLVNP